MPRLDENESGARYGITYTGNYEAMEAERLASMVEGRRIWDWTHFDHVGRAGGWLEWDGKRIAPDRHYAMRDRSWGVHPGVAVIEKICDCFPSADCDGRDGISQSMRQGPLSILVDCWQPTDSRLDPASMGMQDHVVRVKYGDETG